MPFGNSSTNVATTAFVQAALQQVMPTGTRLAFPQAVAPTGWTQDTTASLNDRMMRIVTTGGGTTGGTDSPTLMNVVPSHSHGLTAVSAASATTGIFLGDPGHSHAVGDPGHSHGVADPGHSHGVADPGHAHGIPRQIYNIPTIGGAQNVQQPIGGFPSAFDTDAAVTSIGIVSAGTGIAIAGNGTGVFIGAAGTGMTVGDPGHTHSISGTVSTNTGAANWAPKYYDFMVCVKN
jgi:hypothetical protein